MESPENWEPIENPSTAVEAWENRNTAVLEIRHTGQAYTEGYDIFLSIGHEEGLIEDPGIEDIEEARKKAFEWMEKHPEPERP